MEAAIANLQFDLPDDLKAFVDHLIATGEFASVDDVISDALARLSLDRVKREIAIGVEVLERGEYSEFDIDEIKNEVLGKVGA